MQPHTHADACMHAYIDLYILCSCFSTEQSERAPGNAPVDAKVMKAAGWKNVLSEFILNLFNEFFVTSAKAILILKYCSADCSAFVWLVSQHLTAADI